MHPPHFTPQKHYYFYVSGTPQGVVRLEGLGKFKKSPHQVSNPLHSGL
jgi:hypothetical protein